MRARTAVVFALAVLFTAQPFSSLAAGRNIGWRNTRSFGSRAARADARYGPTSRVSVSDGAGGLYISWADIRDGSGDIFLQRVTNTGAVASGWPLDGLPICVATGDQFESIIMPDGSNGVIVAWLDFRDNWQTPQGYAQRVNSAGVTQWTANGVAVLTSPLVNDPSAAPDGAGGLLIGWSELGVTDVDVYAVRFDGTGSLATGWSAFGNLVCGATDTQDAVMLTNDGAGGAVVAWQDDRSGTGNTHIFAQRLNASGVEQWTPDGVQLDASLVSASTPVICSDGGTGAMVFWFDFSTSPSVLGQHLNSAGSPQWTAGGLGVSGATSIDGSMQCDPDGLGGAVVTWDESPGAVFSIGAQRVNSAGAAQWGLFGTSIISLANTNPSLTDVISDGTGVVHYLWEDHRNVTNPINAPDIYGQRISAVGARTWPSGGLPICTATGSQLMATGAIDGSGGLLTAWQDQRSFDTEIYAQRINAAGTVQFAANGVAVFSNPGVQVGEFVLQTSQGGALVFYNEKLNGQWNIRARKFNADGTAAGSSVPICISAGHQGLSSMIDDGAGGAIVAWTDGRNGTDENIYAQRVDIDCTPQWTANGVAICTASGEQQFPRMVSDGAGGAILAWQDDRNPGNSDVYAQRVNAAGAVQWTANGVAACSDVGMQQGAVMASDGASGAIIAWTDLRNLFPPDIYAQRLNGSGAAQWTANGVGIGTISGIFGVLRVSDAVMGLANDAIVLFSESALDVSGNITSLLHAQNVNSAGVPQWGTSGATVCDASSLCSHEQIVNDGSGGAYVAWSDGRADVLDIYIQHVDGSGANLWTANGNLVCGVINSQLLEGLTRDSGGDTYLTWEDQRGAQPDIYAQRFNSSGIEQWTADGVSVCSSMRGQYFSSIAPYKTASPARLFVAWTDNLLGSARYVYLQRLNTAGAPQWTVDGITKTVLAMVSASADADRVRLEWYSSENVAASVYRRTANRDWIRVGDVLSDGTGKIAFEDRDIVPGASYGYRLGYLEQGQQVFTGETWVDVPTNLRLSLEGLRPNPAVNALVVSFTLPSNDAATIELIDVAGRQVLARELAGLGAGRHTLRLGAVMPPSGVYFLRLTQKGRTVTTRAAVLR